MARGFDPHDYTWKLVAVTEVAGFAYLFWAVWYAAHVGLASL
jgi:hypothetical protein